MNNFPQSLRLPFKTFIVTFVVSFLVLFGISELLDFLQQQKIPAEEIPRTVFVEEGKNFSGYFSNIILTNEGLSLSKNFIKNPRFLDLNGDGLPDNWAIRRQFYNKEKGGVVSQNNYPFKIRLQNGKEIWLNEYILPFTYQRKDNFRYGEVVSAAQRNLTAFNQNGEVKIIQRADDEEFLKRSEPVTEEEKKRFLEEKNKFFVNGKWQTPGFDQVLMITASGKGFDGGHNSYFGPTVSQIIELPEKITERTRLAVFTRLRIDEVKNGYFFIGYCFMDASMKPYFEDLTTIPISSLEETQDEFQGKRVCIRYYEEVFSQQSVYDEVARGFMDVGFAPAGDGAPDYNKIPANARYLLIKYGWYFNHEQWQKMTEEYQKEGKVYNVPFTCKEECSGTAKNEKGETVTFYHPKGRAFIYTPYVYIQGDDLSLPSMPTVANFQPFYAKEGEYISPPIDSGGLAKVAKLNIERETPYHSNLQVETSVRAATTVDELSQKPFTKDYQNLSGRFFQYKLTFKEIRPIPISLVGEGKITSGTVKKVEISFSKAEAPQGPALVLWTLDAEKVKNAENASQLIRERLSSNLNPYFYLQEVGQNSSYLKPKEWKTSLISDYYYRPGNTVGLVAWVDPFYQSPPKTIRFTVLNSQNEVLFDQLGAAVRDNSARFYYLAYQIPKLAKKGFYTFKAEVTDEKGNKKIRETRFYVKDFIPTSELFAISDATSYPYEINETDFNNSNFQSIEDSHRRMLEIGVTRYREWLHLRESFPTKEYLEKGQIEAKYKKMLDYIVHSAQEKGLKITALIGAYPLWMNGVEKIQNRLPNWIPDYLKYNMFPDPRIQPDLYQEFMKNYEKSLSILAKNYPFIDQWELENEKDFFLFYAPGDPKDPTELHRTENDIRTNAKIMADLYYYGRRGIKAGNPNAYVVVPAVSFTNYRYLEALYEEILSRINEGPERANPDNYFDFVSWHPYTEESPRTNVTGNSPFALNYKMYEVMRKYGDGEKLGIISEFGYQDTKPGLYEKASPEKAQEVKNSRWDGLDFVYNKIPRSIMQFNISYFVLDAYALIQKEAPYISSLMWFKLEEPPAFAESRAAVAGFGIFDENNSYKLAAKTYQMIAKPPVIQLEKTKIEENEQIKIKGSAPSAHKAKIYLLPSLKEIEVEIKDRTNFNFEITIDAKELGVGQHQLQATKLINYSATKSLIESSPTQAITLEVVKKPSLPSVPSPSPSFSVSTKTSPSPSLIAFNIPTCPTGTTFDEEYAISQWLKDNSDKLNQYGDPKSTVYSGASPLFDEKTGKSITLSEYVSRKHPERPWRQSKYCKPISTPQASPTPVVTTSATATASLTSPAPSVTSTTPPRTITSTTEKTRIKKSPLAKAGTNIAYIFVASLLLSLLSSLLRVKKRGLI